MKNKLFVFVLVIVFLLPLILPACGSGNNAIPTEAQGLFAKGRELYLSLKYEESIQYFDKAISVFPDYEDAWTWKGLSLLHLDRYDEALDCINRSLDIDPNDANKYLSKGYCLQQLDRYEEALACYNKGLEIAPENDIVWYEKGFCLEHLNRHDEAMTCYNNALKLYPDSELAQDGKNKLLAQGIPDKGPSLNSSDEAVPETTKVVTVSGLLEGNYWGTLTYKAVNASIPEMVDETITGTLTFSITLSDPRLEDDGWHLTITAFHCDDAGWFPDNAEPASDMSFIILPRDVGGVTEDTPQMDLYGAPFGLQLWFSGNSPGSYLGSQIVAWCHNVNMGVIGGFIKMREFSESSSILTNKKIPFNDSFWGQHISVTEIILSSVP